MLSVAGSSDVERLRGRWLELHYAQSFASHPVRPLFRAWLADGKALDWIMPAAVFGRARWLGLMPDRLVRYEILADLPDAALFRMERARSLAPWQMRLRLLARSPAALLKEAVPGLVRTRRGRVNAVRAGLLQEPLSRVQAFADRRSRPPEPDRFDRPAAPEAAPEIAFLLHWPGGATAPLSSTLETLAGQADPLWRVLVAAGPAAAAPATAAAARLGLDDRVTVRPAAGRQQGPWTADLPSGCVAHLSPGDRLPPWTVLSLRAAWAATPGLALLYSDAALLAPSGALATVRLEPDWSPDYVAGGAPIAGLQLWDVSTARQLAAGIEGPEPALARRLLVAAAEHLPAGRVAHLPRPAVHRLGDEVRDLPSLAQTPGTGAASGGSDSAAIVIPTRDRLDLLRVAVESVIEGTDHPDFEVVVADNGSTSAETLDYLDALRRRPNCRVVAVPGEFNFPHIVNRAVAATRAAVVVLLNNDTEVLGPFWLRDLVRHAVRDGVGAVGARLLYPGGRVQHAGVVLGWGGYAGHFGRNQPEGSCDHLARDLATHEVAAVTAACLAVSRAHFDAVGGFDESFAVDFNDVDFCLRLSRLGLRNLLCPSAVLRHHESASRRHEGARRARFEAERRRFGERWRSALGADPFFPLLLSLQRNDERLE